MTGASFAHHHVPEKIPAGEIDGRLARLRRLLARFCPDAAGLLVFSRLNIYYLAGSAGAGVLWIPREGQPVLALRLGVERARAESPLENILPFRSFSELPSLAAEARNPWPADGGVLAAEMGGLSWARADQFKERLGRWRFQNADEALRRARAIKTPWEIAKLVEAGRRHSQALDRLLPARLKVGESEYAIAARLWEILHGLGHAGIMRMWESADEMHLGHISVGESGNYPSHFNGSFGLVGTHPAAPVGGSPAVLWEPGRLLGVDICFSFEGYMTDKTRFYFSGGAGGVPDAARRAHDACLEIGAEAARRLKPGALPSDIYADALARARTLGLTEGFLGLGPNQTSFLGHGIGLSVDEWPPFAKGFDEPLEENMVVALEPKIGLPGLGVVGMEETYRVTPSGGEALTGGPGPIQLVE